VNKFVFDNHTKSFEHLLLIGLFSCSTCSSTGIFRSHTARQDTGVRRTRARWRPPNSSLQSNVVSFCSMPTFHHGPCSAVTY